MNELLNANKFRVSREAVVIEEAVPMKRSIRSSIFGIQGEDRQYIKRTEVHFEPVVCGLTRDALVLALRKLHPSHMVNATPAY